MLLSAAKQVAIMAIVLTVVLPFLLSLGWVVLAKVRPLSWAYGQVKNAIRRIPGM